MLRLIKLFSIITVIIGDALLLFATIQSFLKVKAGADFYGIMDYLYVGMAGALLWMLFLILTKAVKELE